jgi:VWFA-related protein
MRLAALLLLAAVPGLSQFRSTVPLVVAPTTITDSKGHLADGFEAEDLILYDNNVPTPVQVDSEIYPISLVVAVQVSGNARAVLDKLGRSGILFADLVAGNAGETAIVIFSRRVEVRQEFTSDASLLKRAMQRLPSGGAGASTLDALAESLRLLSQRKPNRRRVVLMISERRDRSSATKLDAVIQEAQRQNAVIYWLTYSPALTPFTSHPKKMGDRMDPEEAKAHPEEAKKMEPPPGGGTNLLAAIPELFQLTKPNLPEIFPRLTGARSISFLRQRALEEAIHAVGTEIHRQYILNFQPPPSPPGEFHRIRVEVKGRPDLQARTRAGYWSVQ